PGQVLDMAGDVVPRRPGVRRDERDAEWVGHDRLRASLVEGPGQCRTTGLLTGRNGLATMRPMTGVTASELPDRALGRRIGGALIDLVLLSALLFPFAAVWGQASARNGQFSVHLEGSGF